MHLADLFAFTVILPARLFHFKLFKLRKWVGKLATYEAPYASDDEARKAAGEYDRLLKKLLASGRYGDAVALFIRSVGVSDKQAQALRRMPMWRGLEAMAPTLAYDSEVPGEGHSLPAALLARIATPTLVMNGGAGAPSMRDAAQAIAEAIPNAQLRTLAGQAHGVRSKVLAPVLEEFFAWNATYGAVKTRGPALSGNPS